MKKRKKYKAKKKFPIFPVLVVVFVFLLIYLIFFSNVFALRKVQINSNIPEVSNAVYNNLNRKIVFFNLNNLFLINTKKINQELDQIIEIKDYSVKRKMPGTLIVNILERKKALTCCLENNCVQIDKYGFAFELGHKNDHINCNYFEVGEQVMSEKTVNNILKIKKDLDYLLGSLFFENNRLTLETNQGWRIFFNTRDNISNQIQRLEIVLQEIIKNPELLDYIDLRFGETIYYK